LASPPRRSPGLSPSALLAWSAGGPMDVAPLRIPPADDPHGRALSTFSSSRELRSDRGKSEEALRGMPGTAPPSKSKADLEAEDSLSFHEALATTSYDETAVQLAGFSVTPFLQLPSIS
ncbi:hypothetical protein CYMTET_45373, partial [Cymbomonas tetramitiformis]